MGPTLPFVQRPHGDFRVLFIGLRHCLWVISRAPPCSETREMRMSSAIDGMSSAFFSRLINQCRAAVVVGVSWHWEISSAAESMFTLPILARLITCSSHSGAGVSFHPDGRWRFFTPRAHYK